MARRKPLPASTSAKVLLLNTRLPVVSSTRLKLAGGLSVGASLTAPTLWLITTRPVLKELVPPRLLASITAALVTVLLLSISTTSRLGALPLKSWAGRKRIQSLALRVKAVEAPATALISDQLLPEVLEYCQLPALESAL